MCLGGCPLPRQTQGFLRPKAPPRPQPQPVTPKFLPHVPPKRREASEQGCPAAGWLLSPDIGSQTRAWPLVTGNNGLAT